jgi:tetratricopeptide (TPR) repeat protein
VSIDRAATLRQAEKLLRQGQLEPAIAVYLRVVEDQPADWNTGNLVGDLLVRAGQMDRAIEQFARTADALFREGFLARAAALYKKILKLKPDADYAMVQAGEAAAAQGLLADARAFFASASDARRRCGDLAGVRQIIVRIAALDRTDVAARLAGVDARLELDDRTGACEELRDLASMLIDDDREHDAVVPLQRLVQLDPADTAATQDLARILLKTGAAAALSEVSLEPAPNGPAVLAGVEAAAIDRPGSVGATAPVLSRTNAPERSSPINPHALDLQAVLGVLDVPAAPAPPEIAAVPADPAGPAAAPPADIDEVFARLRDDVDRRSPAESADAAFARGSALCEVGEWEQAIEQLRAAARAPRHRFAAASLLADIYERQDRFDQAIEWLGHAIDAPGAAPASRHATMVRLADLLERTGETAGALAVCLELQADAGEYRDVSARIGRLSRLQTGG